MSHALTPTPLRHLDRINQLINQSSYIMPSIHPSSSTFHYFLRFRSINHPPIIVSHLSNASTSASHLLVPPDSLLPNNPTRAYFIRVVYPGWNCLVLRKESRLPTILNGPGWMRIVVVAEDIHA